MPARWGGGGGGGAAFQRRPDDHNCSSASPALSSLGELSPLSDNKKAVRLLYCPRLTPPRAVTSVSLSTVAGFPRFCSILGVSLPSATPSALSASLYHHTERPCTGKPLLCHFQPQQAPRLVCVQRVGQAAGASRNLHSGRDQIKGAPSSTFGPQRWAPPSDSSSHTR